MKKYKNRAGRHAANGARLGIADLQGRTPVTWAHGVFLVTHPPVDRPETAALIEQLLAQSSAQTATLSAANKKESQ